MPETVSAFGISSASTGLTGFFSFNCFLEKQSSETSVCSTGAPQHYFESSLRSLFNGLIHSFRCSQNFCLQHVSHAAHVGSLSHVVALTWDLFCFARCEGISRTGLHAAETGSKWDFPKCSWQLLEQLWASGPGPSPLRISVTVHNRVLTRHPYQQINKGIAAVMVYIILFHCYDWIGLITFHKG